MTIGDMLAIAILALGAALFVAGIAGFTRTCDRIYRRQEEEFAYYARERRRIAERRDAPPS